MQNQIPSMKRGICPACGSEHVYRDKQISYGGKMASNKAIHVDLLDFVEPVNFVCVNCGYVESYILNSPFLKKIAQKWTKV